MRTRRDKFLREKESKTAKEAYEFYVALGSRFLSKHPRLNPIELFIV